MPPPNKIVDEIDSVTIVGTVYQCSCCKLTSFEEAELIAHVQEDTECKEAAILSGNRVCHGKLEGALKHTVTHNASAEAGATIAAPCATTSPTPITPSAPAATDACAALPTDTGGVAHGIIADGKQLVCNLGNNNTNTNCNNIFINLFFDSNNTRYTPNSHKTVEMLRDIFVELSAQYEQSTNDANDG